MNVPARSVPAVRVRLVCIYAASMAFIFAPSPLFADSTSSSSMQVSNLTIRPADGTLEFLDLWTAQAFAQAQNSRGGNNSQYNSSNGGLAQASASVQFASAQSSSDALNVIQTGSADINIPAGLIAASAASQEKLSNMFEIAGAGGPVSVTFTVLLTSMQSLFTDSSGLFASSEVGFTLSVDGQVVLFSDIANQIGPNDSWTNSFSRELKNIISLNENQQYQINLFADPEDSGANIPEPPTIALVLAPVAVGFVRRLILARRG